MAFFFVFLRGDKDDRRCLLFVQAALVDRSKGEGDDDDDDGDN